MTTRESIQPERGGCLTAFLILSLIGLPIAGLITLFGGSSSSLSLLLVPKWYYPVMGIVSIADFIFVLGMWNWKKWGVYGYASASILGFFINVMTTGLSGALLGLVSLVILYFLIRPVWDKME